MKCQLFIAVVCLISLSQSGQNNNVCRPGAEKADPKPKEFPEIPFIFVADIEMNVIVNKTTKSLFEIFDSANNRAIIGERMATGPYKNVSMFGREIYNFFSNQIVEVVPLEDHSTYCNASQLDGHGTDTFMFGDSVTSKTGFSTATAFLVNQAYPPVYKGKVTLDMGIKTERWLDCHYIPALDATVTAEWYFTDSDDWTPSLGKNHAVPVMLKIKGSVLNGRNIEHTYTFNHFQDFISDHQAEFFMIPQGTVCPHLKAFDANTETAHTIPSIASKGFFSMEAEYVQELSGTSGLITSITEYYDASLMLSRYDYVPRGMLSKFSDEEGVSRPIREIHDFLTGVAYIIDADLGNCTTVPLSKVNTFDIGSTEGTHARMKTVKEMIGLAGTAGSSMNWTYTGQRSVRDITADIYVAEKKGYPPGTPANLTSIWEIAFSSPAFFDITSDSSTVEIAEPLRFWVRIPSLDYTIAYNIYNFDEEEPDVWVYDVANCFTDDQKSNVHFRLEGDQAELMERNRKEFTYWLFTSIIGYAGLSPIRVNGLTWVKDDTRNTIRVSFQVLDPPTIKGSTNDKLPSSYLISTADAVGALNIAISSNDFVVEAGAVEHGILKNVLAIPDSIEHHRRDGNITHYINNTIIVYHNITVEHNIIFKKEVEVKQQVFELHAGAAAGFAIGFLIVGAGLGVLIIFVVNKVKSKGGLSNISLSFSPKTFANED